jgi:putative lipase involved disintegration of autophagic bodies
MSIELILGEVANYYRESLLFSFFLLSIFLPGCRVNIILHSILSYKCIGVYSTIASIAARLPPPAGDEMRRIYQFRVALSRMLRTRYRNTHRSIGAALIHGRPVDGQRQTGALEPPRASLSHKDESKLNDTQSGDVLSNTRQRSEPWPQMPDQP